MSGLVAAHVRNEPPWVRIHPVQLATYVTTSVPTSLTSAWNASVPAGESYTLQYSTRTDFAPVWGSSNTVLTTATISNLEVNTTYYARANAIIDGSSSAWTSPMKSPRPCPGGPLPALCLQTQNGSGRPLRSRAGRARST